MNFLITQLSFFKLKLKFPVFVSVITIDVPQCFSFNSTKFSDRISLDFYRDNDRDRVQQLQVIYFYFQII